MLWCYWSDLHNLFSSKVLTWFCVKRKSAGPQTCNQCSFVPDLWNRSCFGLVNSRHIWRLCSCMICSWIQPFHKWRLIDDSSRYSVIVTSSPVISKKKKKYCDLIWWKKEAKGGEPKRKPSRAGSKFIFTAFIFFLNLQQCRVMNSGLLLHLWVRHRTRFTNIHQNPAVLQQ